MFNAVTRGSNLVSLILSASMILVAIISFSGPVIHWYRGSPPHAPPAISLSRVTVEMGRLGYYHDYSTPPYELGKIHFDLQADLTGLWNWNTKMLFVYMIATFETPTHELNEVVIWDDILRTKEDSFIQLKDQRPEYFASDLNHSLKDVRANLSLSWNVVPKVGYLFTQSKGSAELTFPERAARAPSPQ